MNRKKKIVNLAILAVICVCALFLGFLDATLMGVNLFEEKVHSVGIKSESDILAMGNSFHNNICTLENDIILYRSSMLASRELPFVGEFDGKGHKITLSGNVEESLFGYIGEGGVVKNLHIEVISAEMASKVASILALENDGTVINCKITIKSAILKNSGNYAAVVSTNRGIVRNVVVNACFENGIIDTSVARRTLIGGIAAYNYGEISSCISNVSYVSYPETVKSNIFEGSAVNSTIGAIYGTNNGVVRQSVAVVSEETYVRDSKDTNITFVNDSNRKDVFGEENIFGTLGFNDEIWIFVNNEFSLLQGD